MSKKQPRSLIELGLMGLQASLKGDHTELNAIVGEIGVRSYQMGQDRAGRAIEVAEVEPGDWLLVRQGAKLHHGVCVAENQVIHATVKHGVIKTSLGTFHKGRKIKLVRRCETDEQRAEVMKFMKGAIGQPYDVFRANCEHIASMAHEGKAESSQLEVAGFLAVLATQLLIGMGSEGKR